MAKRNTLRKSGSKKHRRTQRGGGMFDWITWPSFMSWSKPADTVQPSTPGQELTPPVVAEQVVLDKTEDDKIAGGKRKRHTRSRK